MNPVANPHMLQLQPYQILDGPSTGRRCLPSRVKRGLFSKNDQFLRLLYPLKMKLFLENNLTSLKFVFPLFCEYLVYFLIGICEYVKPEPLKEGYQTLGLFIFCISDRLKKIMHTFTTFSERIFR